MLEDAPTLKGLQAFKIKTIRITRTLIRDNTHDLNDTRGLQDQGPQASNQDKLALGHKRDPIVTTPNHTMIVHF